VYNENGIELYKLDKEKSSRPELFTPCNGWMIAIGSRLDNVIAFLTQPGFDLYDALVSRYENTLSDPDKFADEGIAEFLGLREEAVNHNAPIEAAREAKYREEMAARAERRQEELKRERDEYEAAIKNAELSIIEGCTVKEFDVGYKSLLLQLFRENGIELPLKTQGWVKSSMVEIYPHRDGDWSYRYSGNPSAVINGYINKLVEAVQVKYAQTAESEQDAPDDEYDYEFGD
jgi:hypothetical protein